MAIDKLEELKDSGKLLKENMVSLQVAIIRLYQGEEGLIKLYQESFDWEIHWEIINYYKFYRSKKYAQILLAALNDSTKLDNGYYPIRGNVVYVIKEELLSNLISWFGIEIINILDNVETDEDI
ncbi:MAG: hypothetical protein H7Y18_11975 [Clostridiaceae bacterium]|nr:hypothetical protein [Clostridiaceae bacterium]